MKQPTPQASTALRWYASKLARCSSALWVQLHSPRRRVAQHIPGAFANFLRLVLVGNHVRVRHQRFWRTVCYPLRHQVKRVQPPVQGLCDNDSGEAHVAVDLATALRGA